MKRGATLELLWENGPYSGPSANPGEARRFNDTCLTTVSLKGLQVSLFHAPLHLPQAEKDQSVESRLTWGSESIP